MKEVLFVSGNAGKIAEIRSMLPEGLRLITPAELGLDAEIEENGKTFEENAEIKATALMEKTGLPCFADDSGLEVEALKKAPGVRSARYAGEPANDAANIAHLLKNMEGIQNRKARFVTVICLKLPTLTLFFEGSISGKISEKPAGSNGFGYDPVFIPEQYHETFAQMDAALKNRISHRRMALDKMLPFLACL